MHKLELQLNSVDGRLNLISPSPLSTLARWIAARKLHCSPDMPGSVSHPTLGSRLSPSLVVVTSITVVRGALALMVLRGLAETSRDVFANVTAGKKKDSTTAILSHLEICRRVNDDNLN